MHTFKGGFVAHAGGDPVTATVQVDGEWVRVVAGHRRLGAWPLDSVRCERVTVFRFLLKLDEAEYTFAPDDPSAFAETLGAVVDLRPKQRFGLGDRVKAARAAQAAAQTAQGTAGN
ncbi:MAG: hypothetical protein OEX04_20490 [Acidimicrobiia bacterium]|nr:hypothetical protein [Acidimicrobiia bacterium]MDH4309859.1 hypothetical protein [Acidimicrobiia bacterium]MDH5293738.1 hypothetical protein [Acidimicrobiia bacterium]